MSETFAEQVSRVRLMASGDETWDLTPNDIAALKAVLADRDRALGAARRFNRTAIEQAVAPPLTAGPVAPPPESDVFDLAALLLKEAGYHASYRVFQASVEALRAARPPASPPALEAEGAALALLRKMRGWDHLEGSADGPYWRREIDRVLTDGYGDTVKLERVLAVPPEAPASPPALEALLAKWCACRDDDTFESWHERDAFAKQIREALAVPPEAPPP